LIAVKTVNKASLVSSVTGLCARLTRELSVARTTSRTVLLKVEKAELREPLLRGELLGALKTMALKTNGF
jgi:hypothetical protein